MKSTRTIVAKSATVSAKRIDVREKPNRQTGTHKADGITAKGDVEIEIKAQYPNGGDSESRPPVGTKIRGSKADVSARVVGKPLPDEKRSKMTKVSVKNNVNAVVSLYEKVRGRRR